MDIPSTRTKNPRTARIKAAKNLKKIPTALLLKKKAECDANALKIVERMIEPEVDVDWLLKSLCRLNRSHMEDAAEERSIVKLCGYVLCDNPLTKVITKQYQISTLKNKVYDVSKTKNYCSYGCYCAAEYLMEQMTTSPLWLRDQEEKPTFRILQKKNSNTRSRSPPGVEVDLIGIELPDNTDITEEISESMKDNEKTKKNKNYKSNNEEKIRESGEETEIEETTTAMESLKFEIESTCLSEQEEESNFAEKYDENRASFDESLSINVAAEISPKSRRTIITKVQRENSVPILRDTVESSMSSVEIPSNASKFAIKSSDERRTKTRKPKESQKKTISFDTLTSRVEKCLKEWITEKTICLLHGDANEKQKIFETINREEKYAVLCKKLNHLQLEEERDANEMIGKLKPVPHFSALREEAQELELKVRAFWEGKIVIDRESKKIEDSIEQTDEKVETILPLTDHHAPNALRRRIFLDKLNKVLPDLLRTLAGSGQSSQYSYDSERCATVKALVSTFSLSATNIIFKNAEWTMIALIMIKLLGIIDPRMKYLLSSKQATMYISMILMSYKLQSSYLENLITSLTSPPSTSKIEPIDS